jgi:hypothetical protein
MAGIYLTAILTTIVAVGIYWPLIHYLRLPAKERCLWLAAILALPLQPMAFYYVRVPLDHWLAACLGSKSVAYTWLVTCYAPLTEEPAKLLVLLIPAIRCDIRSENFVRYALAIGVGFGIGEMWFLANRLAHTPAWAAVPFYQFGGYFGERLMVCVFHSAFLSVALWRLRRRFVFGVLGAMALHWLGNFPISLMSWNVFGLGHTVWMTFVEVWLMLYFAGAIALLFFLGSGRVIPPKLFYGMRSCPECRANYAAPLFGFNFGRTRYERCPHCQHWHWTKPNAA